MKLQLLWFKHLFVLMMLVPLVGWSQDLVSLDPSDLPSGTTIKGLYHFQEDGTNERFVYENQNVLDFTAAQAPMDYTSSAFYFWIVEHVEEAYFQIYSASQAYKVLSVGQNGAISWDTYDGTTEPQSNTKLVFRMYTDGTMRQITEEHALARAHITTISDDTVMAVDSEDCHCNFLKIGNTTKFYVLSSGQEFADYRAIVFEKTTPYNSGGNISKVIANDGTSYTRITQTPLSNDQEGTDDGHTFVSSKFQINDFGSDDFQITVASGTEGYLGFLEYLHHEFEKTVFQNAQPKLGLKVTNNQIFLQYLDGDQDLPGNRLLQRTIPTSIQLGIPFTLGFRDQYTLVATQNGTVYELKTEVPTEFYFNQSVTNSARVLVRLTQGDINIAYTLGNGVIALNDATGTETGIDFVSTDPYMPYNASNGNSLINSFDWQASQWDIRYQTDQGTVEITDFSPYNTSDIPEFKAINNKYNPSGTQFLGGADYEFAEGWELVKANLGYTATGEVLNPAPKEPYVIMYDKMASKLRVFVYTANFGEANQLTVELKASGGIPNGSSNGYEPKLWGTLQQFKSFDDSRTSNYQQVVPFYASLGRSWYYTDFIMEYDPCLTFFESYIQLSIFKTTEGELTMVGRLQGGSAAAGTPEYEDWTSERDNFLVGVMDASAGSLENSLGDITFNQFENYDATDFGESITATLIGKDIEDWEKEMARLEWEGNDQEADATITEGGFQVAEGAFKISEGIFKMAGLDAGVGASKIGQGVTTIGRGAAKIVAGKGKAKVASAKKLYYDNIKDEVKHGDQSITIPVPDPRPQVVFGEIALKGTLTVETILSTSNYIATPGGVLSNNSPEWWIEGTRGSQPLYNAPLGQFTMLNQPKFAIGVARGSGDRYQAWLKIKEKPYFAHNNKITGKTDDIITLAISVETLNDASYAVWGASDKSYTTYFSENYANNLSGTHDISDLIDWEQITTNISSLTDQSDEAIEAKLNEWIKVSYEVWTITPSNLKSRNLKRVLSSSDKYAEGASTFGFISTSDAIYSALLTKAKTTANNLGSYSFGNHTDWGTNYHVYHTEYQDIDGRFYEVMHDYCMQLNASATPSIERQKFNIKVFLQGAALNPYTNETMLMRDDLRRMGFLSDSPYKDEREADQGVFNLGGVSGTGANANDIVDWVWVELRDATDNTRAVAQRSALLQRDGDVVQEDGISPLEFLVDPNANHHVVIKHRNHLGIMSNEAFAFSTATLTVDFTNANTGTYGVNAQTTFGLPENIRGMWAGDTNGDGKINIIGAPNDMNAVRDLILDDPINQILQFYGFVVTGYDNKDVNLSGGAHIIGANNDANLLRDEILNHPINQFLQFYGYTIYEQLP